MSWRADNSATRAAYYIVALDNSSMLELNFRDEIVDAFSSLAVARPAAPIIVSRTRTVSRRDVLEAARTFRQHLRASALPRHSLIGLAVPNGSAFLAALLALRMEGHPVLLLDPAAPYAQSARAASTMRAAAIVSTRSGWLTEVEIPDVDRRDQDAPYASDRIAVVKLTSGSTGEPRGVATPAAGLVADERGLTESMGFAGHDYLLATLPFSHSYGFTTLVMTALVRGLPLILPEDDQGGPFAALTLAHACGATVFPTVPAYLQALISMRQPPEWPQTVRLVISAGATLAPDVAAAFRKTYGHRVHTFYGSSECGGICYDSTGEAAERGTVGRPVSGVDVSIETSNGDASGPIVVRSGAVAEGYLPAGDAGRLSAGRFVTGDLGVWSGDEIRLIGRADRLINVRGRKVDPAEVEGVLRALPDIGDAVVTAVPLKGSDVPCAVVAPKDGAAAPAYDDLFMACRRQLADYKVPRRFIVVDRIGYTSRGKIDRAWLEGVIAANVGQLDD